MKTAKYDCCTTSGYDRELTGLLMTAVSPEKGNKDGNLQKRW